MILLSFIVGYLAGGLITITILKVTNFPAQSEAVIILAGLLWPVTLPVTIIYFLIRFYKNFTLPGKSIFTDLWDLYKGLFRSLK